VGAGLHQHGGVTERLFLRFMEGAVGHVADDPGRALHPLHAARDARHVVGHGFQRHAHGAGQALADHAQRVADQDALDTGGIGHGGKGGVVGGEHGDLLAARMHFLQARQADGLARSRC
jgi:hypothetical protein